MDGLGLGAVIVTVPWYVLGVRPVGSTLTCGTDGMVPVEGLTLSQEKLVDVVNESPETAEVRLIPCAPGALPPEFAEKFKLVGAARYATGADRIFRMRLLSRSEM